MAVVLNCRKLDPPKISTAPHYIINLLGNKLVPRYFHTLGQFALFVLYSAPWANKSYTFDGRCQIVFIIIIGSILFKILTFSVTSNRFGEGGFLLYPETPWCVMSLCHGARPTTSLYLTRRPHCPRLLLRGAYFQRLYSIWCKASFAGIVGDSGRYDTYFFTRFNCGPPFIAIQWNCNQI